MGYLPACYDAEWKPVGPATANPGHFLFEWASELSRAVELSAEPKFIGLSNRIVDFAVHQTYNTAIGGLGAYNAEMPPAISDFASALPSASAIGLSALSQRVAPTRV